MANSNEREIRKMLGGGIVLLFGLFIVVGSLSLRNNKISSSQATFETENNIISGTPQPFALPTCAMEQTGGTLSSQAIIDCTPLTPGVCPSGWYWNVGFSSCSFGAFISGSQPDPTQEGPVESFSTWNSCGFQKFRMASFNCKADGYSVGLGGERSCRSFDDFYYEAHGICKSRMVGISGIPEPSSYNPQPTSFSWLSPTPELYVTSAPTLGIDQPTPTSIVYPTRYVLPTSIRPRISLPPRLESSRSVFEFFPNLLRRMFGLSYSE